MREPKKQSNGYYWNGPDEEWLRHQYVELGKTLSQIGEDVGCDGTTVSRWLRRKGIEVGPPAGAGRRKYPKLYDEDWLRHQYVDLGKSSGQIKRELGVKNYRTVLLCLHKAGVEIRSVEERGKRHSKKVSGKNAPMWAGGTSQGYQLRKLTKANPDKVCEWCGRTENVQIHHIDHDRSNHQLDNLMWLCNHCNLLEACIYNLEDKGRITSKREGNTLTIKFIEG